jgi:hypothetical protein
MLTFPDATTTTGKSITIPTDNSLTVNLSNSSPSANTTFKINPLSIKLQTGNGTIFSGVDGDVAHLWALDTTNKALFFPDAGDGVFPQIRYSTSGGDGMQLFTSSKPIKITTSAKNWSFNTDGSLTFPNNSTFTGQTLTDVSGTTNYSLKIANGTTGSVFAVGTGTDAYGVANDALDHTQTTYVPYNATASTMSFNIPGKVGSLTINANGVVTVPNGLVIPTGSLTFPDATQQTTAALPYVKTAYNAINATATMDLITATITNTGGGHVRINYTTTSVSNITLQISVMNIGGSAGGNGGPSFSQNSSSPPFNFGNIDNLGDMQIAYIQDITHQKIYRITGINTYGTVGTTTAYGSILIERII